MHWLQPRPRHATPRVATTHKSTRKQMTLIYLKYHGYVKKQEEVSGVIPGSTQVGFDEEPLEAFVLNLVMPTGFRNAAGTRDLTLMKDTLLPTTADRLWRRARGGARRLRSHEPRQVARRNVVAAAAVDRRRRSGSCGLPGGRQRFSRGRAADERSAARRLDVYGFSLEACVDEKGRLMPASMLLSYVRGRHGAAARHEEDGCVKHILEVMLAKAKADGPAMRTVTTRAGQGGAVINWLAESKMPPELSVRVLQASRWMQTRG